MSQFKHINCCYCCTLLPIYNELFYSHPTYHLGDKVLVLDKSVLNIKYSLHIGGL
jgi:hypothetical protein